MRDEWPASFTSKPLHLLENSPLYTHTRKQGRQQSPSGRFGKDRHLLLPRIEPRCLYCRLTARSLITIPTESSPLIAERDPVHTEDEQNNGNTRQYRNKTVCVGCTERTSVVSAFRCSLVYLHCVVPVSMNYTLCLVTFLLKVLQNGRLVRFSKRTNCWCAFIWRDSNQIGHFIRCIQSSSSQG